MNKSSSVNRSVGGHRQAKKPLTQRSSYRWVVLSMGFLAVFGALGFGRFGYSAILPAMQEDLGMSSAAAGSLASWNLGGYVAMAALGGVLASRFGVRLVAGIGSVVAAAGMVLTGMSNGIAMASAARLLTGLGGGAVLVPSVALMSSWFDVRQRGFASAIVSSGSSLALVITGPAVPAIIAAGGENGWRWAWYFFAALTFVVGILIFIAQRNRPLKAPHLLATQGSIWQATPFRPLSETPSDFGVASVLSAWASRSGRRNRKLPGLSEVLRAPYSWHMGVVYFAFGFAYMIYFTFFQKRLIADLGMTSAAAGNYFLVVGLTSIVCGFIWGAISDRIGRGRAIAINCALQAVAAILFAWWEAPVGIVISAFLFGITTVAIPGIIGAGCGDKFGPRLASTSLGFVTIFLGIGQVLGPYIAGKMADLLGTLRYSYLLSAGVFFIGAAAAAFLRETERTKISGGADRVVISSRLEGD